MIYSDVLYMAWIPKGKRGDDYEKKININQFAMCTTIFECSDSRTMDGI